MKAIIMAGGDGARLRPITCTMPKPMVRILDVPVMEYAIVLLRRHGIRDIGVTLRYLPDAIRDHFGDGSRFGVSIRYFTETTALGTAGGVKQAQDFLDETFVVLSGDGITDCDLTAATGFHRKSQAQATLVTVRADDPREYGLVCTDKDGRITRFLEKPDWDRVVCDRVNTGIYILEPAVLERIPSGSFCDFSRHIFPEMLAQHAALYAYDAHCYWCDIGDIPALLRANRDALHGQISLIAVPESGVIRHPSARVDPKALIAPPAYIGENAVVCAGAHVGPDSVISASACISAGASIRRSVAAHGAHIGENAQLRGCMIAEHARVLPGAQVYENAIAGAGSIVGRSAEVSAGVRIWPGKAIPDRTHLRENIIYGHAAQAVFHAGAIDCFTPVHAALCAQALCAAVRPRIVLIAHGRENSAAAQHFSACAGLISQGAQVYDCHCATLMELRSAIAHIGADCACYLTGSAFYPLNSLGVTLHGDERRRFLSLLNRGESPLPYTKPVRSLQSAGRCDLIYLKSLVSDDLIRTLTGFPHSIALYAPDEQLLTLAERAFLRAGLNVRAEWEEDLMELSPDEIGIWLSDSGESARLFTAEGEMTEVEMQLLTAHVLLDTGHKRLILPDDFTPAVDRAARQFCARVEHICGSPAHWANRLAQLAPDQLPLHFDGIASSLHILAMLNRRHISLNDFRQSAPMVVRHRRTVDIPGPHRAHALSQLNEALNPPQPGHFHMVQDDSHIWILPSGDDGQCTILAEAADIETARELCDLYETLVRSATESPHQ